ncbi:MAG: hypothetical protein C0623_00290 [Desulfuromonas sp.]|nr:MAG: hypothetical protein C0623_00290 [Desulfuromonas sp.]
MKWVREKADFIYDNDGNIEGAVGLTQDITQRKEIEAQIIASEEKFRTLYDESPLPYHSLDAEGRFIEVNPAWLKLLGYDEDEVIGKNYGDFLHPDWQPVFAEKFPVFKESGRVHDVHFKIRHKDGHYIDISLGGCISSHPDGTFKNTNCVFVDISDRIQAEADRKQMEAQTIRASQLATLGELSAGVAHEINNPISGVINYAQMILNKADQGTREEDLSNRIINEGERIANIVSKLLSFSRKEEGEHQPHDIRSIIDIPLSLLSKKLEQDGITVNVSIANDVPVLHCNAQQMEQVLLNLINNAQYALNKKYPSPSPEKIIEINVDTLMEKGKPYISLAVKDYGEGIPADVLPEIFGAFYTTKEAGVGTGLGLSIIESIVKIHDGQIKVESEEGEYTNIIIAFPVYG